MLLGAAAYLYAGCVDCHQGESARDGLLWQLGAKRPGQEAGRAPGIAQEMLAAQEAERPAKVRQPTLIASRFHDWSI